MTSGFAAEMLENGARAFASFAATRLVESAPAAQKAFGANAFRAWQDQFASLIMDLAAAMRVEEPRVFAAQIEWLGQAFVARGVPSQLLHSSIQALHAVIKDELSNDGFHAAEPYLLAGLAASMRPAHPGTPDLDASTREGKLGLAYLAHLLEGDRRKAVRSILDAVDGGLPMRPVYTRVLVPVLVEIGRMWHLGEASVAEEHFATDTTKSVMAIIASRCEAAKPHGKCAIVCAAPGNTHDIAVRIAADYFEMDGWRSICLGADIPIPDLVAACGDFRADLVAISAMMPGQLRTAREAVDAIAKQHKRRPRILVGGRAFAGSPGLWKQIGADAYEPSLDDACAAARRLVNV